MVGTMTEGAMRFQTPTRRLLITGSRRRPEVKAADDGA